MVNYVSPKIDFSPMRTISDEAWYFVLLVVLFAIGSSILIGAAAWCYFGRHGNFTGGWKLKGWQAGIDLSCSK